MSTAMGGVTNEGAGTSQASTGAEPQGGSGNGAAPQNSGGSQTSPSTQGNATASNTALSGQSGNGSSASWRDSLPDDIKGDPTLAKYSDVANLAKAYLHAQQAIGKKGVIKPAANATPEEWKAFKEALGVPSEDKYEIQQPKGFNFPKETLDWAKKTCAKIGLLPEDANAFMAELAQFDSGRTQAAQNAFKEHQKTQLEALQKEWGDKYQPELKRGLFAVEQLGEISGVGKDKAVEWINRGIGNDPTFIKMMSAAAKLFQEDKLRENGVSDSAVSQSDIAHQISEAQGVLLSMKKDDPRRPAALQRYESLNRQRTGGR